MNSSSLAVCVGWSVTETRMLTHYRSTGSAGATVTGTQVPSGSFNTANLALRFNKGQSQCHIRETTESHYTLEMTVHDRGCRWSWDGEWEVWKKGPKWRSCGQYEDCSNKLLLQLGEIPVPEAPGTRCQQVSSSHRNRRVCHFVSLESKLQAFKPI